MKPQERLALDGGPRIRTRPFPQRLQFDEEARAVVNRVFDHYIAEGRDFGAQGRFEEQYCRQFVKYQNKGAETDPRGYCDAVSSGTAALHVALAALELPRGSTILLTPIADPGCVAAAAGLGHRIRLLDCAPGSLNTSLKQVTEAASTSGAAALLLIHAGGKAAPDVGSIAEFCAEKSIRLIEDCSQAHGAEVAGRKVGNFGDFGVFSTMHTKTHSSGSNGGLIYTRSAPLHHRARMHADRGKRFHEPGFNPRDPGSFAFPALNLPQDELSCAIGSVTLARLDQVRARRIALLRRLQAGLERSKAFRLESFCDDDSPFFWPIHLRPDALSCEKSELGRALLAEGLPVNPDYRYLVHHWDWARELILPGPVPENAGQILARSVNLLFHEQFSESDMDDIASGFLKVERHYLK